MAVVLLSIIADSLDYIKGRNGQGGNRLHTEKRIELQFLWHRVLHLLYMLLALAIQ